MAQAHDVLLKFDRNVRIEDMDWVGFDLGASDAPATCRFGLASRTRSTA